MALSTQRGETYIVGIRLEELRREKCAGCGSTVMLSEVSWQSAEEQRRNLSLPPGSVKATCRQCVSNSGMVPVSG